MEHYSIYHLVGALLVLIVLAAWFSASETAVMALNRHHLRQLADNGHAGASRVQRLLDRPERYVGFVLLGNRFVVILLAQIATFGALHWLGDVNLLAVTCAVTLVVVLFGELIPKSAAAVHPERIAYPSSWLLAPLLRLLQPLIAALSGLSHLLLRADAARGARDPADREEQRTAVREAGALIPQKHRDMLFGLLDLEDVTVEDIMVPRADIVAIDLDKPWVDVAEQLKSCRHTRVPCYRGTLDHVVGILHMRNLNRLFRPSAELDATQIEALLTPAHFVPVKANLHAQLVNFQRDRQRMALVVDEYGDIEGLVTIDDLLEQVVGKFTTVPQFGVREVYRQADGSFVVDGTANVRELNRAFDWTLPEHGPKTLNGLILEALEDIPDAGTSLRIGDYTLEVVHSSEHAVRSARVFPPVAAASAAPAPGGDEQTGD
ncbi:MAG: HlyC/CorC family transporter [Gammaproteobacteria bacterium]